MALVSDGFFGSIRVIDASGVNGFTMSVDLSPAADVATARTNLLAIAALLDTVTQGLVFSARVGESFLEDTLVTAPAGVQVEDQAAVTVTLEDGGKHTMYVPAPIAALFQDTVGENANIVDLTNADLIALVEAFTDKTGYTTPGADAIALVSDGEKVRPDNTNDVPVLSKGKRIHRANRNG